MKSLADGLPVELLAKFIPSGAKTKWVTGQFASNFLANIKGNGSVLPMVRLLPLALARCWSSILLNRLQAVLS